ncbi:MAG: insulinase family protein, partial [Acidobacteriota bacterium]
MVKKESVKFPGLLLLGILFLFRPAWGSQVPDTAPYFSAVKSFSHNGDAYEAEFRNGMRVIIEESFGIPLAAINALIAPIAGQSGDVRISNAAEFYQGKVEPEIFALGGIVSAGTARNFINIKIVVPAEEIRRALEILGGLESVKPPETSPLSAADSFNLEEIYFDLDQSKIMELTLASVALGRQEQGNGNRIFPTGGGVVSGLTIVGSVQHEKVLNYISEFFPKKMASSLLPLQEQNSAFDINSLNSSIDYAYFRSELDFPIFTVTYKIPPEEHPQRLHVEVLREIIGGGLASLLRVDEEGYSLNFQHRADIVNTESGSYLVVTAAVHPDYLDRVEILVLAGISLLGKTEMPGALITRAKSLYLLNYYRELESLPSRADSWAEKLLRGEVRNRTHIIEMLKELNSKSLKNAGTSCLDASRAFVREFIPAGFSRSFDSETFRETVQILLPQSLFAAEKRLEKLTYNEPEILFSVPVPVSEAVPPELKKSSVLRGPDIYIYEKHNSPLVTAGIYYAGGFPVEGKTNAGMTEILLSSMLQTWSNNGLDNQMLSLEGRGCVLEAIVKPDYFGFRTTVLSSNFETVFSELMDMITSFSVEDDMVVRYRNSVKFTSFLKKSGIPLETPSSTIPLDSGLIYQAETCDTGLSDKRSTLSSWYGMISENHPAIVIY